MYCYTDGGHISMGDRYCLDTGTSSLVHLLDICGEGNKNKYSAMPYRSGDRQEGMETGPKEPETVSSPRYLPNHVLNCHASLLSHHAHLIAVLWH